MKQITHKLCKIEKCSWHCKNTINSTYLKEENIYILKVVNCGFILICLILSLIYSMLNFINDEGNQRNNFGIYLSFFFGIIFYALDLLLLQKQYFHMEYEGILPILGSFINIIYCINCNISILPIM